MIWRIRFHGKQRYIQPHRIFCVPFAIYAVENNMQCVNIFRRIGTMKKLVKILIEDFSLAVRNRRALRLPCNKLLSQVRQIDDICIIIFQLINFFAAFRNEIAVRVKLLVSLFQRQHRFIIASQVSGFDGALTVGRRADFVGTVGFADFIESEKNVRIRRLLRGLAGAVNGAERLTAINHIEFLDG